MFWCTNKEKLIWYIIRTRSYEKAYHEESNPEEKYYLATRRDYFAEKTETMSYKCLLDNI